MKATRRRMRIHRFILPIVIVGLVAAAGLFFFTRQARDTHTALPTVTIAVATSPVSVWSWDTRSDSFTVVSLPSHAVTEVSEGYGRYSLEAFWKLGFIDGKGGGLLTEGLSNALAVPIFWYVGEHADALEETDDPVLYARRLFTWAAIPRFLIGGMPSNMSFPSFVSFVLAFSGAGADKIAHKSPKIFSVTQPETLPDQTTRNVLDPDRLDEVLKGFFEDETIRAEEISVAIYNTTDVSALGNRIARTLSNIGILVVSVGNDERELEGCTIEGSQAAVTSETARSIKRLFDCESRPGDNNQRADLLVTLGESIARSYRPR